MLARGAVKVRHTTKMALASLLNSVENGLHKFVTRTIVFRAVK